MLDRNEALATLGLKADQADDHGAIERSFEKLARRYPPSHFAQRFQAILAARDALLREDRAWQQLLEHKTLDLRWLSPYLPKAATARGEAISDAQLFQDFLRECFIAEPILEDPDLFDDLDGPPPEFLAMIEELLGGK